MRRYTSYLLAVLFLAALPASAQKVLPQSFGRWTAAPATGQVSTTSAPAVPQTVLAEYGWVSTEPVNYATGSGPTSQTLTGTLYQMKDPTAGYGLYSWLRTPDIASADFTDHSSMSDSRALVLIGNLVLDVQGSNVPKLAPDIKSLTDTLTSHAQEESLPTLWEHLPERNMIARTDHYILGPQTLDTLFPGSLGSSLGFQTGAEAELAHYKLKNSDAVLLITDFPTPQLAQAQLNQLQKKFNVNGSNAGNGSPLFAKRSVTLLAIVAGAPSAADANGLLDQVHGSADVVWSEPTFQFNEPSINMMIVGSIVGAGTICLFALIAGVSFGGLRLIVKRLFPDKVFDRTGHLEVLQLGLGSKPINCDDFYGYSATDSRGTVVDRHVPDRIALRIFR